MHEVRVRFSESWFEDHHTIARPAPLRSVVILPSPSVWHQPPGSATDVEDRIEKAVQFIQGNAHRPFKLNELLEICVMQKPTFEWEFAAKLGIDPYSFINRCRIERACMLLGERRKRLMNEVATMSGFSGVRSFRITFRRLTGISPTDYQRKKGRAPVLEGDGPGEDKGAKTNGATVPKGRVFPAEFCDEPSYSSQR